MSAQGLQAFVSQSVHGVIQAIEIHLILCIQPRSRELQGMVKIRMLRRDGKKDTEFAGRLRHAPRVRQPEERSRGP